MAWDPLTTKYASLDNPEWVQTERLPPLFWDDPHNHTRYLKWLGKKLGIKRITDWYNVRNEDFLENRGGGFLEHYYGSHYYALKANFPHHSWKAWLFHQASNGFWHDLQNCAEYVTWFEKQKKFKTIEGWYNITQDDVYEMHGAGLLTHFDCSVQRLIQAVYPNHDWKPWLFVQVPKNFWPERENRIAYMKWLEARLGYKKPEDWYQVSKLDFIKNQGASLMQFGHKTVKLIRELYPKRQWLPWKFKQVYQGYWNEPSNRIAYLRWLEKRLGYKVAEDWKQVKRHDFVRHDGGTMFSTFYHDDPHLVVKELYPEAKVAPWEFHKTSVGFWNEPENCRAYLDWLGNRLGFRAMEDWYKVKRNDFYKHNGGGFIKRFKTAYRALNDAYPDCDWLPWKFENVPVGFWQDETNRKWYLGWLAEQLELKSADDWQSLTAKDLRQNSGDRLLPKFTLKEIRKQGASLAVR